MNVLVTAFKPFNNLPNNFSAEVLKYLTDVDKVILDVVYDDCYKELITNYNLDDYDLIIALGEARMRNRLSFELQAKNISSCSISDNNGILKKDEKIISDGQDVMKTNLKLFDCSVFGDFSSNAGTFVCNNLYYYLLSDYPDKSLFIHIPDCESELEIRMHALTIKNVIIKLEENNFKKVEEIK